MNLHEEDSPSIPLLIKSYMDWDIVPVFPHLIKEVFHFKAIIKPFILKGGDHLVGHTKSQQLCFYMYDDGITTMQFSVLCTLPNLGLGDGIFVWRQDEHGKRMLPDGEPNPCTPNLMRNGPKINMGISGLIEYTYFPVCGRNYKCCLETHEPVYYAHSGY